MSRIVVDDKYCKCFGLCIDVCPRDLIVLDTSRLTAKGYHPAHLLDAERCTACQNCAIMCPDAAITVYKEVR